MSDLKTLDDIPIPNRTFTRRILKDEAVKWVKSLRHIIKHRGAYFKDRAESERRTVDWIMNFFNLTEEDLK